MTGTVILENDVLVHRFENDVRIGETSGCFIDRKSLKREMGKERIWIRRYWHF